jgi:hypothetical protein
MTEKLRPTDSQIVETIQKIAKRLSKKFRFGYFTSDDIEQEIAVLCLQAMPDYDGERPLENFLWTHAHNRLCNLKRDKYERRDKPCLNCPLKAYDPMCKQSKSECTAFENKNDCKEYSHWIIRNEKKKNLVNCSSESSINLNEQKYEVSIDKMDKTKLMDLLDKEIPIHMRADYIKFKYGIRLNKIKQEALTDEIRSICEKHGVMEDAY